MAATRVPISESITPAGGLAVVAAVAATVAVAVLVNGTSYDVWACVWVGPVLLGVCWALARRMAAAEGRPGLARLFFAAAVVKVVGGGLARYAVAFGLYGGDADAARYDSAGRVLAPTLRAGVYQDLGKISGTRFVEIVTGQLYALTGPSLLAGFLVYSFVGFLGLCCLYQAFRLAVPDGDLRRYRLLIFFYPTMVFWSSGIGKDSLMVFALGLVAYGATRLLDGSVVGGAHLLAGLWLSAVIRPHITLIVLVALAIAVVVFTRARSVVVERPHRRGFGLLLAVVVVAATVLALGRAEAILKLDQLDADSAQSALSTVTAHTSEGGSSFHAVPVTSPVTFVEATVTVLFRPFPFEVHGPLDLATSAEGLLLAAVVVASWRRLLRLLSHAARAPYVMFAGCYLAEFTFAFANIGNFGILARERVQVLPFVFVLLCLPLPAPRRQPWDLAAAAGEPSEAAPAPV